MILVSGRLSVCVMFLLTEKGVFMSFSDGLDKCMRSSIPVLFVSLTLFGISYPTLDASPFLSGYSSTRQSAVESVIDYTKNDLLLGSHDPFFWFLVPMFGILSIGICVLLNYVALLLTYVFAVAYSGVLRLFGSVNPAFVVSSLRRRLIVTGFLIVLVWTVIPYQFLFIVLCIAQLATCVRALSLAREAVSLFILFTIRIAFLFLNQTNTAIAHKRSIHRLLQLHSLHLPPHALDPPDQPSHPRRLDPQPHRPLAHPVLLPSQRPQHPAVRPSSRNAEHRQDDTTTRFADRFYLFFLNARPDTAVANDLLPHVAAATPHTLPTPRASHDFRPLLRYGGLRSYLRRHIRIPAPPHRQRRCGVADDRVLC